MIEGKRKNLIEETVLAFKNNQYASVSVNTRIAAESLCKLMILHHYGEERGSNIIYSQDKHYNKLLDVKEYQKRNRQQFVLAMLKKVILKSQMLNECYQKKYSALELSSSVRSIKKTLDTQFELLIIYGNASAHEPSSVNISSLTTTICRNTLSELLIWLYKEFLNEQIPQELVPYIGFYDIFISYRHTNKEWIETLVENLEAYGYRIFLDTHQLVAGDNVNERLENAIKKSSYGIVVYPHEDSTGWVQKELNWMHKQEQKDANFKVIPLLMHSSKEIPNEQYVYVDFKTRKYAEAFNDLLCSLKQRPCENHINNQEALKIPIEQEVFDHTFTDEVMESLEQEKIVVLFSQEFSDIDNYKHDVETRLIHRFLGNFHKISIPSFTSKRKKYFSYIAKCCGIEGSVSEVQEWKEAMQNKLQESHEKLVLFITDLEDGNKEFNREFATALRSLQSAFPHFHVLLVGRKNLASLVYANDDLSPLNVAESIFFPDTNVQIKDEKIVLAFERLKNEKAHLLYLLSLEQISRYSPWSSDKIINRFFWKNFIVRDGGYLVWRSEALKSIAREVLGCENV